MFSLGALGPLAAVQAGKMSADDAARNGILKSLADPDKRKKFIGEIGGILNSSTPQAQPMPQSSMPMPSTNVGAVGQLAERQAMALPNAGLTLNSVPSYEALQRLKAMRGY